MIRRPRRSTPAIVVALVILACCVLVVVCCIQQLTGHQPVVPLARLADFGRRLYWHDIMVMTAGAVAAAWGIVLLACALVPGTPTVFPLADGSDTADPVDAGLTRRGFQQALERTAADADSVTGVRVRASTRTVVATVRSVGRNRDEIGDRVRQELDRRIDLTALARRPRLRVHVRTRLT
ncbi:MAG TPA: DUF6286 domain-containing protein [Pseudonocardiaceae bacterium]